MLATILGCIAVGFAGASLALSLVNRQWLSAERQRMNSSRQEAGSW